MKQFVLLETVSKKEAVLYETVLYETVSYETVSYETILYETVSKKGNCLFYTKQFRNHMKRLPKFIYLKVLD